MRFLLSRQVRENQFYIGLYNIADAVRATAASVGTALALIGARTTLT